MSDVVFSTVTVQISKSTCEFYPFTHASEVYTSLRLLQCAPTEAYVGFPANGHNANILRLMATTHKSNPLHCVVRVC